MRFRTGFCLALSAVVLLHCGSDTAAPPAANKKVGADGGPAVDLPPPPPEPENCDGTKLPTATPCTIHEAYGVFVSAKGSDEGDGTRAHPLQHISTAIAGAAASGRRVYACAETYDEVLTLGDGISVFGYFECQGEWKVGGARAVVAPKTGDVAAVAKGIAKPTRIEALEIRGRDATEPSQSSIGLKAEDAGGLSFVNTRIAAGKGMKGKDGAAPIQLVQTGNIDGKASVATADCTLAPDLFTCDAQHRLPPAGGASRCVGAAGMDGGPGGSGGHSGRYSYRTRQAGDPFGVCLTPEKSPPRQCYLLDVGDTVTNGGNQPATAQTAAGAIVASTSAVAGLPGSDGVDGATGVWKLTSDGFVPGDGTDGSSGTPGQGGGGGAGEAMEYPGAPISFWGGNGAGGGAGGCPGLAGKSGTGGGASIAVLATRSAMRFDAKSEVVAGAGGTGGAGHAASAYTLGGAPGVAPSQMPAYTRGAPGGRGGEGGVSGHGASGPSIGIAWKDAKPTFEKAPTVAEPAPGQPADGRLPAAPDGIAVPVYAL